MLDSEEICDFLTEKIMDFLNRNLTKEVVDFLKENHPLPRGGWTVKKSLMFFKEVMIS